MDYFTLINQAALVLTILSFAYTLYALADEISFRHRGRELIRRFRALITTMHIPPASAAKEVMNEGYEKDEIIYWLGKAGILSRNRETENNRPHNK